MTPVFLAVVEKGKLRFEDPVKFGAWLSKLIGKTVKVTIERPRKPRSTGKYDELGNQNGYLWSVVYPIIGKELGYEVKEVHELCLAEFAPYVYKDFAGKKVAVRIRSSEMNTLQCAEYTDAIRRKMAELDIFIPDPQSVKF